jgi:hypothetical protein
MISGSSRAFMTTELSPAAEGRCSSEFNAAPKGGLQLLVAGSATVLFTRLSRPVLSSYPLPAMGAAGGGGLVFPVVSVSETGLASEPTPQSGPNSKFWLCSLAQNSTLSEPWPVIGLSDPAASLVGTNVIV